MKSLLLTVLCCGFFFTGLHAQESTSRIVIPVEYPTNIERYGIDYELKDYSFQNGDSTILNTINLDHYDHLRNPNHYVEVLDPSTGLTIILYHEKRSRESFTSTNQNQ